MSRLTFAEHGTAFLAVVDDAKDVDRDLIRLLALRGNETIFFAR